MLLVVAVVSFLLLQRTFQLPAPRSNSPANALPDSHTNRPLQGFISLSRRLPARAGRRIGCGERATCGANWVI